MEYGKQKIMLITYFYYDAENTRHFSDEMNRLSIGTYCILSIYLSTVGTTGLA